jgi:thioredoxin 1
MIRRRATGLYVLLALVATLATIVALTGCGSAGGSSTTSASAGDSSGTAKVTFVELGSNSCIPCKEMKPVMAAIQETFGEQIEIVFYDVWEDDAPAREYGISMIPTQVFLDENGEEFHRHVGFYPQEEIEALLVERGLTRPTATQ